MNILQKMGISMPFEDGLDTIPELKPLPNYDKGDIIANRYEVIDRTNGARGDVYHCADIVTGKEVAAKGIISKDKTDRSYIEAFMEEVRIRCALPLHPNVIGFERIVEHEGYYYILSEWIAGTSLTNKLEKHAYSLHEIITDIQQICCGLIHCYSHLPDFVYGDLKPDNILLESSSGLLKLSDFSIGYTPGWASPEQLGGDKEKISQKSDVYCLGLILSSMFRRVFFFGDPLREELRNIADKCLEMDIESRPESISDILASLDDICGRYSLESYKPEEPLQSFRDNYHRWESEVLLNGFSELNPELYISDGSVSTFLSIEEFREHIDEASELILQSRTKNVKEAIKSLSSDISINEKSSAAYIELAQLWLEQGDIPKSLECLDAAVFKDDSIKAYDLKANVLLDHYNIMGIPPVVPMYIKHISSFPEARFCGYLYNQTLAKYYLLSAIGGMADNGNTELSIIAGKLLVEGQLKYSSHFFRRSLQYVNVEDEWRTLYYYALTEELLGNTDNYKTIFEAVIKEIDNSKDPTYEKDTKMLSAYLKLGEMNKATIVNGRIKQRYGIDNIQK